MLNAKRTYLEVLDVKLNRVVERHDFTDKPRTALFAARDFLRRRPGVYIQFRYPEQEMPRGVLSDA